MVSSLMCGSPFCSGLAGGLVVSLVLIGLVVFAIGLLEIAGYVAKAVVFMKAGEKPWKAIIPVYDKYVFFRLCWDTKMFVWYAVALGVYLFGAVGYTCLSTISFFSFNYNTGASDVLFSLLVLIGGIAFIVFDILLNIKIASAYGKNGGFAVGLIFLYNIFMMILAFGDARYREEESEGIIFVALDPLEDFYGDDEMDEEDGEVDTDDTIDFEDTEEFEDSEDEEKEEDDEEEVHKEEK